MRCKVVKIYLKNIKCFKSFWLSCWAQAIKQKIVSKSADQQQGASSQSKSRLLLDLNSFTVVVGAASDSCAIWTALFDNEFHEKPRSSRGSSSCSLNNRQIANLAFRWQFCLKFIQGCCSGYTLNTSIFHVPCKETGRTNAKSTWASILDQEAS